MENGLEKRAEELAFNVYVNKECKDPRSWEHEKEQAIRRTTPHNAFYDVRCRLEFIVIRSVNADDLTVAEIIDASENLGFDGSNSESSANELRENLRDYLDVVGAREPDEPIPEDD